MNVLLIVLAVLLTVCLLVFVYGYTRKKSSVFTTTFVPCSDAMPLSKEHNLIYYIGRPRLNARIVGKLEFVFIKSKFRFVYMPDVLKNVTPDMLSYNMPGVSIDGYKLDAKHFYKYAAQALDVKLAHSTQLLVRYDSINDRFVVFDVTSPTKRELLTNIGSNLHLICKRFDMEPMPEHMVQESDLPVADECYDSIDMLQDQIIDDLPDCQADSDSPDVLFSKASAKENGSGIRFRKAVTLNQQPLDTEEALFCAGPDEPDDVDQDELIKQAKQIISKLLMCNVSRQVILSWIDEQLVISTLKITEQFKIILPEYNNMEISLTPLEKTVYLFFLMHPEGIAFKELSDYKADIRKIYGRLARTDNLQEIERSVSDLVEPFGSSISEKCAHIKAKFTSRFIDEIARNYYITGRQGCPRRITLDRAKVIWEADVREIFGQTLPDCVCPKTRGQWR